MKIIKAGIIGLGRMASLYEKDKKAKRYYPALTHAGAYEKHPLIKIACGADIDAGKQREFRKMWGVNKLYTDYREMLKKEDVDILSICTPPEEHLAVIEKAAGCVKTIFCEKPFTASSAEIRKVIELKNRYGLNIAINLYRQYDISHNNVKALIQDNVLGRTQRVNCYYGKGLRNMGSHVLGYILSIFGLPQEMTFLRKRKFHDIDEYSYDIHLKFAKDVPIFFQACDFSKYRLLEFDFLFEKGRIRIADEGLSIDMFTVAENRAETGAYQLIKKKSSLKSTIGNALYEAVDSLVQMSNGKDPSSIVTPEDYLKLELLIEKIEKMGEEGEAIKTCNFRR